MKLQRYYRGRRLMSLLAFLGFASVIFICFQLFSFEILNLQDKQDIRNAKKIYGSKHGSNKSIKIDKDSAHYQDPSNNDDKHNIDNIFGNKGKNNNLHEHNILDTNPKYGKNSYKQYKENSDMPKKNIHLPRDTEEDAAEKKCLPGEKCSKENQAGLHVGERGAGRYMIEKKNVSNTMKPQFSVEKNKGKKPTQWTDEDYEGLIRGIIPPMKGAYTPNLHGMFTCLKSQQQIPFSYVNDDYCDCVDSSDEPGTSACPESRFYCRFQISSVDVISLPSHLVNDGICDCCDGSDEWLHLEVREDVKDPSVPSVHQSPCQDRCGELRAKKEAEEAIHQQGAALKQEYLQRVHKLGITGQFYGPENEFYPLSQDCYEAKFDKYHYEVCPFQRVSQRDGSHPSVDLGRTSRWEPQGTSLGPVLRMEGGEHKGCPGGRGRKSFIQFECGVKNAILSILESEVCEYTIKFSSPAAC